MNEAIDHLKRFAGQLASKNDRYKSGQSDGIEYALESLGESNLIESADCLALCQSLFGDEWRVMVRAALLLFLRESRGGVSLYKIADLVGIPRDKADTLQTKTIAAGVKLARGEE